LTCNLAALALSGRSDKEGGGIASLHARGAPYGG